MGWISSASKRDKVPRDLIAVCQYQKGSSRRDRDKLSWEVHSNRMGKWSQVTKKENPIRHKEAAFLGEQA